MSISTSDVSVNNSTGLTDAELRATPVPVSIPTPVSVTGPLTDAQLRAVPVPVSGTVSTTPLVATTSNITQVVLTNNTNATLLSVNTSRIKAIIFVPSQTLQIKLGAVASATSFTYKITSASTTIEISGYTGRIDAFGSGQTVTITELS